MTADVMSVSPAINSPPSVLQLESTTHSGQEIDIALSSLLFFFLFDFVTSTLYLVQFFLFGTWNMMHHPSRPSKRKLRITHRSSDVQATIDDLLNISLLQSTGGEDLDA
jgi:hypothetical protein